MLGTTSIVLGGIVGVVFLTWLFRRARGTGSSTAQRESRKRHEEAQQRDPPVDIGDTHTVAVHEFTEHHTGETQAVCKVEGFVVFVEDIPADLEVGDTLEVKILSFNRGHTSATATFQGRA
ncbi:RNA-binding protein [Natronolimnobius sp. AArcel1]|uniref:TRAM domain-containing protein n=1 Tax=Natronolimnobius sp. AArcel1 TaxID=1679093 RepID=UPI0013EABA8B|nr:RNA-binding protein [Natronolimnobius sp. AArcel1]NGM70022.1 RNA-binding protein [Natronolimnobius sp. AArcel1]